jgi:phosphate:Na+ symporter
MDINLILLCILGGLAFFLYGMKVLSEGLQMAFGNKLNVLLNRIPSGRLQSAEAGFAITSVVQSSSVTTITLVGLINAGIITLSQAVYVIIGANIGTTLTTQLVAFRIDRNALLIIAFGIFLNFFVKSDKLKYWAQIITGLGILFLGMSLMSSEIAKLAADEEIVRLISDIGRNPLLGVLISAIFTGITHNSSSATALVVAMGMTDIIDLQTAIPFILGANIGTTFTIILATFLSSSSTASSKRAVIFHLLFNIIGVIFFLTFIGRFEEILSLSSVYLPRQIAYTHLFFNLGTAVILFPLTGILIKIISIVIPSQDKDKDKDKDKNKEEEEEEGVKFLDNFVLDTPAIALAMAEKEISRMLDIAAEMIKCSREALFEKCSSNICKVKDNEKLIDQLDDKAEVFMSKINKEALSKKQQAQLAVMLHAISDIERIADHANNICELAQKRIDKKIKLSEEAFKELNVIYEKTNISVQLCRKIIGEGNPEIIAEILAIEKEVDNLVNKYEDNHLLRLEQRICTPEAGPVYMDILRNLERITDHTHNVAYAKRFGF